MSKGCWYNWGLFDFAGFLKPIPSQIIIIIDLSDCTIDNDIDTDPGIEQYNSLTITYPHLTNKKMCCD